MVVAMIAVDFDPDQLVGNANLRALRILRVLRAKGIGARIGANSTELALPAVVGFLDSFVTWIYECVDSPRFEAMTPREAAAECIKRIVKVQG